MLMKITKGMFAPISSIKYIKNNDGTAVVYLLDGEIIRSNIPWADFKKVYDTLAVK